MTGGVAIFLILTAAIETAAVVCACLPVIGPQIVKLYRRRAAHSRSDYPYYGDSGTPSSKRSARLRNWRSRGGGGGGGGGPPGQGGFTQFGSLNHITDLDETIATHHDDGGSGRYGDEVELTSVPADHQNLGGRDDSWERALHAFVPDSSLPQKQGQILVRTDVEVEVSSPLLLLPLQNILFDKLAPHLSEERMVNRSFRVLKHGPGPVSQAQSHFRKTNEAFAMGGI